MVHRIHFIFIGLIVTLSFVAFRTLEGGAVRPMPAADAPSMIPGAEAVRPLAANQSLRVNELVSELTSPAPEAKAAPAASEEPVPTAVAR